jgi:DNA-3-methyladenine glycosylase II
LRKRPDAKALNKIAEAWRPWRGVAAHLMWAYYHVAKKREGIDVETKSAVDTKKHWPQIKKIKTAKKTGRRKPAKKIPKKYATRKSANGSN